MIEKRLNQKIITNTPEGNRKYCTDKFFNGHIFTLLTNCKCIVSKAKRWNNQMQIKPFQEGVNETIITMVILCWLTLESNCNL